MHRAICALIFVVLNGFVGNVGVVHDIGTLHDNGTFHDNGALCLIHLMLVQYMQGKWDCKFTLSFTRFGVELIRRVNPGCYSGI